MTIILGINAFHGDSAACIVRDGRLLAAAEEERFTRIKHWAGFPEQSIRYCLREAGIGIAGVDHVAINQDARASMGRKLLHALMRRPDPAFLLQRLRHKQRRAGVAEQLQRAFPGEAVRAQVHAIEHHFAHLSSAFHVSPFDEAVAVSVDGFGDFASAAWGLGSGGSIRMAGKVHFPHSLGIFYETMTRHLGFPNYGDEYKVMGLAPYGRPTRIGQMRQIVRLQTDGSFRLDLRFFRHHSENIAYEWTGGEPKLEALYSAKLAELLGPPRAPGEPLTQEHHDIAHSTQAMYEEALFHLLNALHARYRIDRVALSGGCAMNSVANGKITRRTPFSEVYVQSAAGDAGGAIGAAFSAWHALGGARGPAMTHAYWGPSFDDAEIDAALAARTADLQADACEVVTAGDDAAVWRETASAIADGQVVGWFHGRMEWGPRALGNRSILGDPRRADMKDILNLKIKRRESFRPFAPSVLREAVPQWFELDGEVPFMMQVYPIREEQRARIPAVTHVDGTGRLQTVRQEHNPMYHGLITEFARITGVPMVLNTSFNENEPVVCTPQQALDCFLRTRMDLLVMGRCMVRRPKAAHA